MKIDKVIAISGKPGLYHLISQTKSGFIAENLDDGKKTNVPASYNVSLLSNVAIYTTTEEVPLAEVFRKIYDKENGGETINHRSPEVELRNYMEEVLPDYDKSRVYHSDLKKLFQWYNILLRKELLSSSKEQKAPKTSEEE
ncbi:DUF5606 domain-containing protein [Candidatus Ornithobacterium hominis]|uniref:DUF5606 family protein n=1 Tax=Candidatus Ornithobacterium hominis TaxID=2497989 RepID=UPI0024BCB2CD|nr:DUF5606 domain-containing protein [Candidatus Ornithobacterium hominis]CAI9429911.1 DUF5606 domain-containing protein [Candidatus Ornithobacterium hominis]